LSPFPKGISLSGLNFLTGLSHGNIVWLRMLEGDRGSPPRQTVLQIALMFRRDQS
jgi:hypothetical protein